MKENDFTYYKYILKGIFSPDEDGNLVVFQCEFNREKGSFAFSEVQNYLVDQYTSYIGKEIFCIKRCENNEYKIVFTDNCIMSVWAYSFINEYETSGE